MLRIRRVASFMGPDWVNLISFNHGPYRKGKTTGPPLAHRVGATPMLCNGDMANELSPPIDYRTALAGNLFDSPGVYAFLVGSGMSSAAGIMTGWQVVQELVRRIARDRNVDLEATGLTPDEWWEQEGFGELSYSALIEGFASTELARRALLRRYFEPGPDNPVKSTVAHHRLAQLCALGLVKVIITTNFDPLVERALAEAGLTPQVISNESQVKGMTPLHHAPLTVIKVHGDYASPVLKNTDLELSRFGRSMNELLDEVFDRFGLVSVGWSATWDHALREALERRSARRYPTYYAAHDGHMSEAASSLTAQQQTKVIAISGANEFFGDLVDRVEILAERARRHTTPRRSKTYLHHVNTNSPPYGWTQIPLLTIRMVGTISTVGESVEPIGPDERDKLVEVLNASRLVAALQKFQGAPLTFKYADSPSSVGLGDPPFVGLAGWEYVANANQSTDHAVYRIGTDGSSGISSLAEIRGPSQHMSSGNVTCFIDIGFSVEEKLQLEAVAELVCTGLVAVTNEIPDALVGILPPDAHVNKCEIQLLASHMNSDNSMRNNAFSDVINLELLQSLKYPLPTNPGQQMMYAANVTGALSRAEAAELVVDAIGQMAVTLGYMDPRKGQEVIKRHLEVLANF